MKEKPKTEQKDMTRIQELRDAIKNAGQPMVHKAMLNILAQEPVNTRTMGGDQIIPARMEQDAQQEANQQESIQDTAPNESKPSEWARKKAKYKKPHYLDRIDD